MLCSEMGVVPPLANGTPFPFPAIYHFNMTFPILGRHLGLRPKTVRISGPWTTIASTAIVLRGAIRTTTTSFISPLGLKNSGFFSLCSSRTLIQGVANFSTTPTCQLAIISSQESRRSSIWCDSPNCTQLNIS